jgi:hypothetical protein
MPNPRPGVCPPHIAKTGSLRPGCVHDLAANAGGWAATPSIGHDPWDEVARQREIHDAALAVVEAARHALMVLATRSRAHRRHVSCDQEDWARTIADCLDDMVGDTFGCLPQAIARAQRELARGCPQLPL